MVKLAGLFRRGRAEEEMAREVAAHLALLEDEYRRRGLEPEAARLAARRAYGGIEQAKELHRAERGFVGLEQWLQDLRHAGRSLMQSPGFTTVAMLSLALGIGVNTAVFTLVHGILLTKLPVPDPGRIVEVQGRREESNGAVFTQFSYPVERELHRQNAIFTDVIGFSPLQATLDLGGNSRKISLEMVTGSYFSFLEGHPALGRLLDNEDDRVEGARRVCVLSYAAWQAYFGGDPEVLHHSVRINGVPLQIVGVASADFTGAELQRRFDVWAPTALNSLLRRIPRELTNYYWISALARLAPGVSPAEAGPRLQAALRSFPDNGHAWGLFRLADASRGYDSFRTSLHDPLMVLMGTVALVLLVACANLANLLLARSHGRHREFAIKLSLGATRGRLLRQLLLEVLALAAAGGMIAFAGAAALTRILLSLFNAGNRFQTLVVQADAAVLGFTLAASVVAALIAGLYPGWQASRADPGESLKSDPPGGLRRSTARRALILVQVTLSVVLLFGASLLTHSLRNLKTINLGYDLDHVLTVDLAVKDPGPRSAGSGPSPELSELPARVRQLPGVEAAAFSNPSVLSGIMVTDNLTIVDAAGGKRTIGNIQQYVGPGYFSTMRIPVLQGRDFRATDRTGSPAVAVVSRGLAVQAWPGRDPIGQRVENAEVVGVVGDSKYGDVRGPLRAIAYRPLAQGGMIRLNGGASLAIRCRAFGPVERDVRQLVGTAAPNYRVSDVASMEVLRDSVIAQDRLLGFLASLFGAIGIILAVVGVYGLVSYSVARRTREIGIRMSVGAQAGHVRWLVLREVAVLMAVGIVAGLPAALGLARFLSKILYQVSPSDPLAVAATLLLLALGGLAASYLPGRRATRIDPVQALRAD